MKAGLKLTELEVFKLIKKDVIYNRELGKVFWKNRSDSIVKEGAEIGVLPTSRHKGFNVRGRTCCVHRLIYWLENDTLPEMVDHKNRDPRDNRIDNLRAATRSQNGMNANVRSNNKLGVKNVSPLRGKYKVQLYKDKKGICIGTFESLELAELIASEAREKYHGEFCCHG